ncbi:MAG: choline/carnitine O-acyltransferase [Deltaproteobacteria bacterium]|nr:choline/carnitine O-acyltransferase [Deltaproteobacteria bacterium]
MDVKPLSLRPMPPVKDTLAELRDAARYAETSLGDRWRRDIFFTVARSIIERSATLKQGAARDWQNQTMTDAYLTGRESLALFSNISYLFEKPDQNISAVERAANLTRRALLFHRELKTNSLAPEVESGYLLESEQYPYFFGTSRLPGELKDARLHVPDARHFVVAYQGHFYRIDLDDTVPTCADLVATFQGIVASPRDTEAQVGLLTALPRPSWAMIRRQLATSAVNASSLSSMDEALFLLALDFDFNGDMDQQSTHRTAAMRHLILGNFASRWFDKSHQLIVTGDGTAGINRDHSFLDGHPTLRYVQYLNAELETSCVGGKALNFASIKWQIDNQLAQTIATTATMLHAEAEQFAIDTWDAMELGTVEAKALGLNADFIMQAAIHMACFKVFGRFINSTEAVHMRHTQSGRYDSILTLTPAMARLVHEFGEAHQTERRRLISAGQEAHRDRIRACKKGHSPVLHLTALLSSNITWGPLSLKSDGIYWRGRHRIMAAPWQDITACTVTTSHPGARPGLACSGFTDTYPGVVGVSYLVKSDRTTIYLKADHDKLSVAAPIKREIAQALVDLMAAARS